jgi:hypothetical protein
LILYASVRRLELSLLVVEEQSSSIAVTGDYELVSLVGILLLQEVE